MRRFIYSVLSSFFAVSIASTAMSCQKSDANDNFKKFKSYIDKKETFIYYVGAKNCTHCHSSNIKFWDKLFKDGNLTEEGKKEKRKLDIKFPDLAKPINLKGYHVDVEDYNNWTQAEDWTKELKKWVAEQVLAMPELQISGGKDKTLSEANVNFNGTPMFIFINNGKFAGYSTGTSTIEDFMSKIEDHLYIEDWFKKDELITTEKESKPDDKNDGKPEPKQEKID